jgi:proline dehydrogenase
MVTWILSSPWLVRFSIPIMQRMSQSPFWFLDPERNPILHRVVRAMFYDHFCAGENEKEVKRTISSMKEMGFEGVILGYAKETLVDDKDVTSKEATEPNYISGFERAVEQWKRGTLETLAMLGPKDFLAIK